MGISQKLKLLASISNLPNHIAFIMDGNRRYAVNKGLNKVEGHRIAANTMFDKLFFELFKLHKIPVKELSFFALSYDNYLKRPKEEVDTLFALLNQFFLKFEDNDLAKEDLVKIQFIGDYENYFDKKYIDILKNVEEKTKNGKYILNFLIMYDGREEMINSFKKINHKISSGELNIDKIDQNTIKENSISNRTSTPDLIVRTGGEKRLSGFFLYDSYYSEFMFLDKFWPEITSEDIIDCIIEYSNRDRRNGK